MLTFFNARYFLHDILISVCKSALLRIFNSSFKLILVCNKEVNLETHKFHYLKWLWYHRKT